MIREHENNLEIEYKFWADSVTKEEFHNRIEDTVGKRLTPFYVVSCDDYYTRNDNQDFVRYRKGGGQTELTLKFKRKQNTIRKEINLNVSNNDDLSIVEFLKLSGYTKAFSVFKEAWIYYMDDCDISYYILSDGRSVIEVEAKEPETASKGVEIIDNWSANLGLNNLRRETRSLFEIFTDER